MTKSLLFRLLSVLERILAAPPPLIFYPWYSPPLFGIVVIVAIAIVLLLLLLIPVLLGMFPVALAIILLFVLIFHKFQFQSCFCLQFFRNKCTKGGGGVSSRSLHCLCCSFYRRYHLFRLPYYPPSCISRRGLYCPMLSSSTTSPSSSISPNPNTQYSS